MHASDDHIGPADDPQLPNEADTESPRGPSLRIGHRHIDLAEFVNEGKLRRKYLLENSKTNAMISVSLDITVIKAQAEFTKYIPFSVSAFFAFLTQQSSRPVLRQDHILIGRKESPSHPRSVAGGTHSTNTTVVLSRPSLDNSFASASTVSSTSSSSRDSAPHSHHSNTARRRSPASTRLSTVHDTEAIIEALFNPPVFSLSTHATLSHSNRTKSSQSTAGRSATTATAELLTPDSGDIEVGEFGAKQFESPEGIGNGVKMETSGIRRPSVATTATSATTSSGGWGGDDEQNLNMNLSQRGRLMEKLKKPFTLSSTRRAATPTPIGSRGNGLNTSSTSISGLMRSSLDIVYSAPVPALDEMKNPTLTGDGGAAHNPQAQRQMYHPSPQTTSRTLHATPMPARLIAQ